MRIDFEVIGQNGAIAHRGSFNLHATDERRAFAERVADAQMHGCEVRSWRNGCRPVKPAECTHYSSGQLA